MQLLDLGSLVGQFPYLVVSDITIYSAAGAPRTLQAVLTTLVGKACKGTESGQRGVWKDSKSRYGLRYGNDAACADFQGLTGLPASCKSLIFIQGAVLSRR